MRPPPDDPEAVVEPVPIPAEVIPPKARRPRRRARTPLQIEVGKLSLEAKARGERPVAYRTIIAAGGANQTARKPKENGLELHRCERDFIETLPASEKHTLASIEMRALRVISTKLGDPDVSDSIRLPLALGVARLAREHGVEEQPRSTDQDPELKDFTKAVYLIACRHTLARTVAPWAAAALGIDAEVSGREIASPEPSGTSVAVDVIDDVQVDVEP